MASSEAERVSGAILIGGRSRRMGRPKALLRVPVDGPTMLERVAAAMPLEIDERLLIGHTQWPVPAILREWCVVGDEGGGPLAGVVAGLRAATHPMVLVVACDLPFLQPELLSDLVSHALLENRGVYPAVRNRQDDVRVQPLVAVYHRGDLPHFERRIAAGEGSMQGAVAASRMTQLPIAEATANTRLLRSFYNVNTIEELDVARRWAEEKDGTGGILTGMVRDE